jgi:predicted MFS family arabinose efflux permease
VVVVSLIAWSAVTAATGLASTVWQLATLRVLLGFSECLFLPAAFALLADHHGAGTRARAMSIVSMGVSVGVVAGGAVAGYFAELFGWRHGFWILGGVGVLVALTAGPLVTEPVERGERVAAAPVGATLKFLAGIRTYHVMLAEVMLAGFAVWIFLSWLPLYFRENFRLGLGAAGFAGTFMLQIMATVGIAVGGWMSDTVARKGPRRRLLILAASDALIAPMLLVFFSQPGLALAIVIVSTSSLIRGMGDATEKPSLCEVVPPCYRATAIGLTNSLATAAGGLGVFLAGWLKEDLGLNGVFAACAAVYCLAAALLVLAYRFWMAGDIIRMRQFGAGPAALGSNAIDIAAASRRPLPQQAR